MRGSTSITKLLLACHHKQSRGALMTSQERYSQHSQLEHLQSKYVGTGHADTTK